MAKRILIAEDDITMVSLLKTLLKMEGFEVVAIQPDADVPASILREKPDVALLDVHLSGQSGLAILSEIRNNHEISHTRVILSSGSDVRDECARRGANGFLMKPYMPDDLITILKQVLQV